MLQEQHKKYICLICGYIYDESLGSFKDQILTGTKWDSLPEDWVCPECGAKKEYFELVHF